MPRSRASATSATVIVIIIDDAHRGFPVRSRIHRAVPRDARLGSSKFRGTRTSPPLSIEGKGGGGRDPLPIISLFRVQRHRRCASSYVLLGVLDFSRLRAPIAVRDLPRRYTRIKRAAVVWAAGRSDFVGRSNAPSDCYRSIFILIYILTPRRRRRVRV